MKSYGTGTDACSDLYQLREPSNDTKTYYSATNKRDEKTKEKQFQG